MLSRRSLAAYVVCSLLLVVPVTSRAEQGHVHDIVISSNQEFDRNHGVTSGRGTKANPYVFKGLEVQNLTIQNTSKAVKIVNSTIGTLTLNFIGSLVEVADNDINDLRVNENVPRTGMPTGGRFISNWFGEVGQIRHFDGRFAYNTVGFQESNCTLCFGGPRAVNFDGFNGAMFDHNVIFGSMDARLHGHHHSSRFSSGSHMHAGNHHDMVDHTVRYHDVRIFANRIHAPDGPYALAYLDTNHADNDRTAASETNEELEKPHVHLTKVAITGNTLTGSGLFIDVFNAEDERHTKGMPHGWLTIADNHITLERSDFPFTSTVSGIDVYQARHLSLRILHNSVTGPGPAYQQQPLRDWAWQGEGILLEWLQHADVLLDGNSVTSRRVGIRATQMTADVGWTVRRLRTSQVEVPVSYDSSVENAPRR